MRRRAVGPAISTRYYHMNIHNDNDTEPDADVSHLSTFIHRHEYAPRYLRDAVPLYLVSTWVI